MMTAPDDNSGVFVGFPEPRGECYDNSAYVGVNFGFDIQIDELARPDNSPIHRTDAIYSFKGPTDGPVVVHPVGEWNHYEITVDGGQHNCGSERANDKQLPFHRGSAVSAPRTSLERPRPPIYRTTDAYGRVLFRNIRWKAS
jgi:hypothetical protein